MRLFVGIPFSEEISKYLKEIQRSLPEAKMRLTKHFHITLQFLGDVEPEKLEEIKNHLRNVSFEPFTLKLGDIGIFKNNKGYIKVVWIGISIPEELKKLQKNVEEELKKLGFQLDKPFKAHLTLARVTFADDKKFETELNEISITEHEDEIDHFILYRSHLEKEGPRYEELLRISA